MKLYKDKKFVYSGPSWAAQSYNTPSGNEPNTTNLLKEWGLGDIAINISKGGSNHMEQYEGFKDLNLPVIYVMCEPLSIFNDTPNYLDKYFDSGINSVWDMRTRRDKVFMESLSKLDNRVAVIGAHSDVSDIPDNVTVIDSSWQNFLRQESDLDTGYNWGVEVLHTQLRLSNNLDMLKMTYKNRKTVELFVDKVWNQFDIWKQLEQKRLFCDCHPTKLGNELYAKHTINNVQEFLGL
jgi:hypothetical protein